MVLFLELEAVFLCRYFCQTFCTISGKSERLPLQIKGTGIGPVTQFLPCKLDLEDLYLYHNYKFEVQLQNKGELEVQCLSDNFPP
jgi:hydrocephalus-inducing protein